MITLNDFSFLIVTRYNDKNRLLGAYTSIRNLYPENEIVLVYDNVTAPPLNSLDKNLIEVHSTERVYVSRGYNLALKHSTKKCFVFVHDDTFLAKNFLENMIPHISEQQFCNFTTIEPPVYDNPDTLLKPIKDFGRDMQRFDFNIFYEFCELHTEKVRGRTVESPFGGFFMAGFKQSIMSVGGFDESFQPYFYEDADLMIRLHQSEFRFVHVLDSIVYHMVSLTSRGTQESEDSMITTSRIFIKKWKCPWEIMRSYSLENKMPYRHIKTKFVVKNLNINLKNFIDLLHEEDGNVLVKIDGNIITKEDMHNLQILPYVLHSMDTGKYELGNLLIEFRENRKLF